MKTKYLLIICILSLCGIILKSCNTRSGIGKEISKIAETGKWKIYAHNPVIIPEAGNWDGGALGAMITVIVNDTMHMYYEAWGFRSDKPDDYSTLQIGHWIIPEKGAGPFGHVTLIFSATAERAYLYWLRYEYSNDTAWLKNYAYPVIKGAVEFYRNFPNLRKEEDGKYHLYHTNGREGIWDAHNSFWDIAAIRGLTPILIRAAEILKTDNDLIPVWKEFVENIAPLPASSDNRDHLKGSPDYWIGCVPPAGRGVAESPQQMIYYDYCTIGTSDKNIIEKSNAAFNEIYKEGVSPFTSVHVLDKNPVAAALLGKGEAIKYLIPNQIRSDISPERDFCDWKGVGEEAVLENRMTLREGPGALGCQRLGNAATALNNALLQSVPPEPGGEPVIYLFPAWPAGWDAEFNLLARRGFMVSSSINNNEIGNVEIQSQQGGKCIIKNPWPGSSPMIYRNGEKAGRQKGDYLRFDTSKGEIIEIVK